MTRPLEVRVTGDVFGDKFMDLLRLAGIPYLDPARAEAWTQACSRYSEKAVFVKLQEMTDRGYVDYGMWPKGAYLTDKGKQVLESMV